MRKSKFKRCLLMLVTILLICLMLAGTAFARSGRWIRSDGGKMYQTESGEYYKDTIRKIGDKYYYFDKEGHMATDTAVTFKGKTYYFGKHGDRVTGWIELEDGTHYFAAGGVMAVGTATIDGVEYTFDENGVLIEDDTPTDLPDDDLPAPAESIFTKEAMQEIYSLEYTGKPYAIVNHDEPFFLDEVRSGKIDVSKSFESYSGLDDLGRCTSCIANVGLDLMPESGDREPLQSVTPTGWHNRKYDFIDGGYVYNRCHLIARMLTAEEANEKNLITGTRYMNTEGMLPWEIMVGEHVENTEGHVLYRVTPVFEGDNLLAKGVLMEAYSVENDGEDVCFCVFAFNVQPGVVLDYATGMNYTEEESEEMTKEQTFIVNTRSGKFHKPDCDGVKAMSERNKKEVTDTLQNMLSQYEPCSMCITVR